MTTSGWARKSKSHIQVGDVAAITLLVSTWILLLLAWLSSFALWYVALIPVAVATAAAIWAWWWQSWSDRLAIVALLLAGVLLYTPPTEHLPLASDSAIYPNEAAFLARTGGLHATYEPLVILPEETRTLFYVTNDEQFSMIPGAITVAAYDGLLYGGYYVTDEATMTIRTSRMALSTVWLALLLNLSGIHSGIHSALYATGLFATLGLILLYTIGRRFFAWPVALWVALLLAVSFTQIHFGRAPYAEITGQFWTLAGVLYALRWLDERQPWLLVLALACWVTTWAGRIDALLLLGPAGLLFIIAATDRDWRGLRAVLLTLPLFIGGIWLSTNGVYVAATYELLLSRWPWFGNLLIGLLVILVGGVIVMWIVGCTIVALLQRLAPLLQLVVSLGFALIILWATVPNSLRVAGTTRNFQEIIWFSSQLLSPSFYWLALCGVIWLLWRRRKMGEFWLLTTTLLLALAFFYSYTSAAVYPASLRRLVSDVIPLLTLMAGVALAAPWPRIGWANLGILKPLVAVALIVWMGWLSWPVYALHEGAGTIDFLETFHDAFPPESVILFETQDEDSWVGWLAAPLYSLYGDNALLLDSDTPDPALFGTAASAILAAGRPLYIVSQQQPLPTPLVPPDLPVTLETEMIWQSSLIGQSPTPDPLLIWHFAHPLYLYRVGK